MAKYGSDDVVVSIDISDGGALTDLTQYLLEINGIKIERLVEESHTFGDSWFEYLQTGLRKGNPIQLTFFYDDTASTVKSAFVTSAHTQTRSLRIAYGGSNQTDVEVWIVDYEPILSLGKLHRLKVTLQPTGAFTEA